MSRWYGMSVTIKEFDPSRIEEIKNAANGEWDSLSNDWFLNEHDDTPSLTSYGEGNLCGGESEEEFTDRLTRAVWKANGAYCKVEVCATYLEELPYETHELDEDDYEKSVKENGLKDNGKGEGE